MFSDQEQAPAARRLVAGQLGLEVGRLGLAESAGAALVGDLDAESRRRRRGRGPAPAAPVGTRCRARSRSSSPRRPRSSAAPAARARTPQRRHAAAASLPDRLALVPGALGDVERRPARWRIACSPARAEATSVMSSSCSQRRAGERPASSEERGRSAVARRRPRRRAAAEPRATPNISRDGSCASVTPVAVEQQVLRPASSTASFSSYAHARSSARAACRVARSSTGAAVGARRRQVVPCVREARRPVVGLENAVQAGDEHVRAGCPGRGAR